MRTTHETRLKKLEDRLPSEPSTVTIVWYGDNLPGREEIDRARVQALASGIDLRFQIYSRPDSAAGPRKLKRWVNRLSSWNNPAFQKKGLTETQ